MQLILLTLASFLAYFVMSSLLAPIGLQIAPLAAEFDQAPAQIGASFGWLTTGVLLGSLIAVPLYARLPVRPIVMATYAALTGVLIGLPQVASLDLVRALLGVAGALSGLGLAGAALIIAASYAADRRTSMLVVTDASFSSAGYVIAPLAGWLLVEGGAGRDIYLVVAGVSAAIVGLLCFAPVPALAPAANTAAAVEPGIESAATSTTAGSPKGARRVFWAAALGLLCYTLGQQSLLIWLPATLVQNGVFDSGEAGVLVGRYWTGMFIGQLFVAWWLLRAGTQRVLWLAAWGAALGSVPLWLGLEANWLGVAMLGWGLANLALLKVMLGYVSDLPGADLARLLPRLLFAATSGTALAPLVSAAIADRAGASAALMAGSGFLLLMALATTLAIVLRPRVPAPA